MTIENGPLGFDENPDESIQQEVVQVAVVRGRKGRIITSGGEKKVSAQARLVRTPAGLVAIVGGDGMSINVDDLRLLLNVDQTSRVRNVLSRDRKRRKENLQGK